MKDCSTNIYSGMIVGKFSLSVGSGKKKDKKLNKMIPDLHARGGVVWPAQVRLSSTT